MQCSSWTNIEQGYILLFSICKCFSISISCNRFFIQPDYLRKRQVRSGVKCCLKLLLSHRIFSKFSVKKRNFNIHIEIVGAPGCLGLWSGIKLVTSKKGFPHFAVSYGPGSTDGWPLHCDCIWWMNCTGWLCWLHCLHCLPHWRAV